MTRTTQNVNLSNQQRAEIGNKNNAAAVIHLHCDGGESSVRGAHTISPAKNNPYCSEIFKASSKLAQSVIQSYSAATGIKSRGVSYRNDLTGINWSQVPSIYIEMGFISNVSEDKLLADSSFQNKCAKGIADGIDKYFQ
jgi:N-acetylmuramoyl-L-alanine amidase